jgi:hypothetical protein
MRNGGTCIRGVAKHGSGEKRKEVHLSAEPREDAMLDAASLKCLKGSTRLEEERKRSGGAGGRSALTSEMADGVSVAQGWCRRWTLVDMREEKKGSGFKVASRIKTAGNAARIDDAGSGLRR